MYFFLTPIEVLKLNHQMVQLGVDPIIQFGLFCKCGKKKLLSNSYFVTQVQFVPLKSLFSNYFFITNLLQFLFIKIPIFTNFVMYICVLCSAKNSFSHLLKNNLFLKKLDGVGHVDNRPSTDKLHYFVRRKKYVTCDM